MYMEKSKQLFLMVEKKMYYEKHKTGEKMRKI